MTTPFNPLTDFPDFLDPGKLVGSLMASLFQPFDFICSLVFTLSYETILLLKFLHPNMTWFLKIYKIIDRLKLFLVILSISNLCFFLLMGNVKGAIFYIFNTTFLLFYCYLSSRLVVRNRESTVWGRTKWGPGVFPGQIEERAGGYRARNQFFIAVSKKEYFMELAIVTSFFNLCLIYWLQDSPIWTDVIVITDMYMLAFMILSLVTNVNMQHGKGACLHPGIMLFRKGFVREYLAVLRMKSMDIDVEMDSKDKDAKHERVERLIDFFRHPWYFLLENIDAVVSLNIVVKEDSYDLFLVLKRRTLFVPPRTSIARMNSAIKQITTSINSTLNCRLDLLFQEQITEAMNKMQFCMAVPRRLDESLITRFTEPDLVDTIFSTPDGYISLFKLDIEKLVRSDPHQYHNEPMRVDSLINSLMAEKINARYMFSLKLKSVEKIELGELLDDKRVISGKIRHGYLEGGRNFEYLINSARISAGLFIHSPSQEEHVEAVAKARGIIRGTWEVNTRCERNPAMIPRQLACNGVEMLMYHVPCFILFRFFQLPTIPSSKQERRFQFQLDQPPDSVVTAGTLNIGKVTDPNGASKDFMLSIEDLKRHVFINGTTGSGKSVFTYNLIGQITEHFPTIPFLVLELKGEYASLGTQYPGVSFLEPGINFSINIFNPVVDVHVHAERVFNILKTSFDFSDMKDFSPQMEKVLVDLIIMTCSDPDPTKRCFAAFFQNAQRYVNNNKAKIPYLESTWIGIENRLRRITTGALRSVFDGQQTQDPTKTIMMSRSIVSLSNIVRLGGTKDDLYFIANLILKMVWDANITRGPTKGISHITFVDDAQYFSRTRGNSPVRETNFLEDIALLLRGTGEVLVAISTRPDISADVLSNCGLIVCFQTKFKEDVQKLKGLLHLPEEKASNLEILPEHTSIIKLNSYPSPFTLETRKPYLAGQDAKSSMFQDKPVNREQHPGERGMPRDYAIFSQFLAKVKQYYQLKDHAWANFAILSKSEMEDLEKRILSIGDEIGVIMHNNNEIKVLVKNSRASKSPDVYLCKIRDELLDSR
jgi:hypothetical protein